MEGAELSYNLSLANSSAVANGTLLSSKVSVYGLMQTSSRVPLLLSLILVGIVGVVGNILVLCFLKSKERKAYFMKTSAFEKNFHVYIRSLAVSDVLVDAISLPPICCQLFFDVFNRGWGCRIVRYLNIVFVSVTMNNLLFISIERYLSTRQIPRTLKHSTVKKLIVFAWCTAFVGVLVPAATYRGIKIDVNDTHYIVVCKYDNQYLPFRIMFVSYISLQYILPGCIIIRTNVSLIITLWTRLRKRKVDVQRDNTLNMIYRAAIIRGTSIIVTLTFAFVLPYFFYFAHVIYNMATQKTFYYESDFMIRVAGALLAYSNSAINVIIYMVQMKGFRTFVKKIFAPRFVGHNENQKGWEMQQCKFHGLSKPNRQKMFLQSQHKS